MHRARSFIGRILNKRLKEDYGNHNPPPVYCLLFKVLELQVSLTSSDGANKTLQSATEKESKLRKTVQANLLMTQGQVKQLEGQIAFLEADRIAMIASRELSQSRITELEMVLTNADVEKKAFQSTSTIETDLRQRIQTDLLKTQ